MSARRAEVVDELAHLILSVSAARPRTVARIAITGITASGKSTLAAEVVTRINGLGRHCVGLAVDGFHNPRAIRYRRGRESPEGYYRDAFDYAQLIERVLVPLGSAEERSYVDRVLDLDTDAPVTTPPVHLDAGSIVVCDGVFLLRPEVRDHFDLRVFVHTAFEVARGRGVGRDAPALGGVTEAERLYRERYHAAQRLYFAEVHPLRYADAVFLNDDLEDPALFIQSNTARLLVLPGSR